MRIPPAALTQNRFVKGPSLYTLKIVGIRRNILAVHHCETQAELTELLRVYAVLGYDAKHLLVEEQQETQAA